MTDKASAQRGPLWTLGSVEASVVEHRAPVSQMPTHPVT